MSNISSYPVRPFSEAQKFFAYDPTSQTSSLVTGEDIKAAIQLSESSVVAVSTLKALKTQSYDVGQVVQTSGENIIADTGNGLYVIQPAGSGGVAIFNGNEAVQLPLVNVVVSDISSASVINDFGTRTAEQLADVVDLKVFRAANAAGVELLPARSGYQVSLSGAPSGTFEFSAINLTAAVNDDPDQTTYIAPASDPTGASGAWVKCSGPEVGDLSLFSGSAGGLNRRYKQGWRIADGTDGTPNLMDSFPKMGAFLAKGEVGGANTVTPAGGVSVSTSVSVFNHTLSVAQMPSHGHTFGASGFNSETGGNSVRGGSLSANLTTSSAGSSSAHAHGASASSSGSFSGATHTNEPKYVYFVPLYFTAIAGTYS